MIDTTIEQLRIMKLIQPDDITITCMDDLTTTAVMFGAIGHALAAMGAGYYIMSANKESIRMFEVDRKSGEYQGKFFTIRGEEIIKASASGLLGSFAVHIKTNTGKFKFTSNKKLLGHVQKEQVARMKSFFVNEFGKKRK